MNIKANGKSSNANKPCRHCFRQFKLKIVEEISNCSMCSLLLTSFRTWFKTSHRTEGLLSLWKRKTFTFSKEFDALDVVSLQNSYIKISFLAKHRKRRNFWMLQARIAHSRIETIIIHQKLQWPDSFNSADLVIEIFPVNLFTVSSFKHPIIKDLKIVKLFKENKLNAQVDDMNESTHPKCCHLLHHYFVCVCVYRYARLCLWLYLCVWCEHNHPWLNTEIFASLFLGTMKPQRKLKTLFLNDIISVGVIHNITSCRSCALFLLLFLSSHSPSLSLYIFRWHFIVWANELRHWLNHFQFVSMEYFMMHSKLFGNCKSLLINLGSRLRKIMFESVRINVE